MAARDILFFEEDVNFKLNHLGNIRTWLCWIAKNESHRLRSLNYIYCSDTYLLEINKTYLNHTDYTDIITFDNSEKEGIVIGDIFISIDRAIENARHLNLSLEQEVLRLLVHGLLHLLDYNDKSSQDKTLMTEKEDYYLSLLTENSI